MADQEDKPDVYAVVEKLLEHVLDPEETHFSAQITDEKWQQLVEAFKKATGFDLDTLPDTYRKQVPHAILHMVDSLPPIVGMMFQQEALEMLTTGVLVGIELRKRTRKKKD